MPHFKELMIGRYGSYHYCILEKVSIYEYDEALRQHLLDHKPCLTHYIFVPTFSSPPLFHTDNPALVPACCVCRSCREFTNSVNQDIQDSLKHLDEPDLTTQHIKILKSLNYDHVF